MSLLTLLIGDDTPRPEKLDWTQCNRACLLDNRQLDRTRVSQQRLGREGMNDHTLFPSIPVSHSLLSVISLDRTSLWILMRTSIPKLMYNPLLRFVR